ncbi:MAG TPA: PmeII family type II restriction endonuclease [Mycobacteriales bacterium]|nr:PmeII family type II restriction endonuclease [Mycobacteriales bacterium]
MPDLDPAELAATVRRLAGIEEGNGPDDDHIVAGVLGFVERFDFWYARVMANAVHEYRKLIVARINPFIRSAELGHLGVADAARQLVGDYARRNFVTAGGWAMEELAIEASPRLHKSATRGIDAEWFDNDNNAHHLYVLKSGTVTRNSDILASLKRHGRQAEQLLRQGRNKPAIHVTYGILAGKRSSSFADGVERPASAALWAEILGMDEEPAIELATAMANAAGRLMTTGSAVRHISALETLVAAYIENPKEPEAVDWEFIARHNLRAKPTWAKEAAVRQERALAALAATGYEPEEPKPLKAPTDDPDDDVDA